MFLIFCWVITNPIVSMCLSPLNTKCFQILTISASTLKPTLIKKILLKSWQNYIILNIKKLNLINNYL